MGLLKNFHKASSQPLFKLFSLFFLLSIATFLYYNQHTRLALFGPHLLQLQNISTVAGGDDSVASNATRLSSPPPSFDDDGDDAHEQIVGGLSLSIDQERAPSSEQGSVDDQERRSAPPDCDIFDGRWVEDDNDGGGSSLSYAEGSCPYVDDAFNCYRNGRPDSNYTRLRWKPKNCDIPRLDGKKLLEMLRGKRLALVGDSLNRNMWESLVCILRDSLDDKERMYEVSGRKDFRADNSYAFRFIDYNCSIEYFRSIFLVQESEVVGPNGTRKETLRLDSIDKASVEYKDADVIVFNTAHWWTHEKTSQGKDYYQEGDHVYSQLSAEEALLKALQTWGQWVDTSIDPNHTRVFFRGYSSSHFGYPSENSILLSQWREVEQRRQLQWRNLAGVQRHPACEGPEAGEGDRDCTRGDENARHVPQHHEADGLPEGRPSVDVPRACRQEAADGSRRIPGL